MEASAISDSWTTVHHVALSEEDETYRNPHCWTSRKQSRDNLRWCRVFGQ